MKINLEAITAEDVIQAYEKTGLRPSFRKWGDGSSCGCAITALMKYRSNEEDFKLFLYWTNAPLKDLAYHLGVSLVKLRSFINGFDCGVSYRSSPLYQKARGIREAVLKHFV